jgi:hypothetical protein
VIKLNRSPGAREQRWAHLLCGPVDESHLVTGTVMRSVDYSALERIERLEGEVALLHTMVAKLCSELGIETTPRPA